MHDLPSHSGTHHVRGVRHDVILFPSAGMGLSVGDTVTYVIRLNFYVAIYIFYGCGRKGFFTTPASLWLLRTDLNRAVNVSTMDRSSGVRGRNSQIRPGRNHVQMTFINRKNNPVQFRVCFYLPRDRQRERFVSPWWEPAVYRFSTVSYPFRARRFLISAATKEDFPVERVHRRHRRCRRRRHDIQTQEEALLLHW